MERAAKILYLSAPIGAGHVRAAKALLEQEQRQNRDSRSRYVDIFEFFPGYLGQGLVKAYLASLRVMPSLYAALYRQGNRTASPALRDYVYTVLAERLQPFVAQYRPDAVVCTHAAPAGLLAMLKRQGKLSVPLFGVVTDFVVHRLWLYPEIERYFLAHKDLYDVMLGYGVPRQRCEATGIPVGADFAQPWERSAAKQALGLDPDLPLVMLMGGGEGLVPLVKVVQQLDTLSLPFSIMAIAGRNERLERQLNGLAGRIRHPLQVCGFVEDIPQRLAAADLLLSKAGGLTAAEAFARQVPLLIYRPLPGQEEANARFLVERGAANAVKDPAELVQAVSRILTADLLQRQQIMPDFGRPQAAQQILKTIFSQLRA